PTGGEGDAMRAVPAGDGRGHWDRPAVCPEPGSPWAVGGGGGPSRAPGPGAQGPHPTLPPQPGEAEMALRSVASDAQRHQQLAVQKEFRVNGSALAVRWASEDTGLLRISINSFLDHLSLVMRSIHRIWPPFPLSLGWEKKAET
uniref:L antigen family member 3 n=1 Tax=Prolemur simus TaxID=1328070 RepID=A0A8C8YMN6_PROSS